MRLSETGCTKGVLFSEKILKYNQALKNATSAKYLILFTLLDYIFLCFYGYVLAPGTTRKGNCLKIK